ncbi:MAG: hypothetical protein J4A00_06810 [Gammaproteobacteria bacterium]|nr:hypothetical protein [Gammaproteobacteria bacterium]
MSHKTTQLLTATILLLLTAPLALAEGPEGISKEAFLQKMEQRFDRMDANSNGVLDPDERPTRHYGMGGDGKQGHACPMHGEGKGAACPHHGGGAKAEPKPSKE